MSSITHRFTVYGDHYDKIILEIDNAMRAFFREDYDMHEWDVDIQSNQYLVDARGETLTFVAECTATKRANT